jgi:hypothetical protein
MRKAQSQKGAKRKRETQTESITEIGRGAKKLTREQ